MKITKYLELDMQANLDEKYPTQMEYFSQQEKYLPQVKQPIQVRYNSSHKPSYYKEMFVSNSLHVFGPKL